MVPEWYWDKWMRTRAWQWKGERASLPLQNQWLLFRNVPLSFEHTEPFCESHEGMRTPLSHLNACSTCSPSHVLKLSWWKLSLLSTPYQWSQETSLTWFSRQYSLGKYPIHHLCPMSSSKTTTSTLHSATQCTACAHGILKSPFTTWGQWAGSPCKGTCPISLVTRVQSLEPMEREKEKSNSTKLSSDLHTCSVVHVHSLPSCKYTHNNSNNNFKKRTVLGITELEVVKGPNPCLLTPKHTYFPSPLKEAARQGSEEDFKARDWESLDPKLFLNPLSRMPIVCPCQA